MGADAFYVYFGLRYTIEAGEEVGRCERGEDPRIIAARKARLNCCFDRPTDGEPHFLLIGASIGRFGVDNTSHASISTGEIDQIITNTRRKLQDAGFMIEPQIHFQLAAQF